jgi:hypothetical protein
MKVKKRTYNPRRARVGQSYTVQDIAELYGIHKNAILRWVKDGLPIIDKQKPYLIHGGDLREYLQKKRAARKQKCRPDEFYCCKCRVPRRAWENVADIHIRNASKLSLSSLCAVCSTPVFRAGAVKKLPEYQKIFSIQTIQQASITVCNNPIVNSEMRKEAKG